MFENFSLIQILILLFIVWPFLKKLFEPARKPEDGHPQQPTGPQQDPNKKQEDLIWGEEPVNWDDAFKDLEDMFTGKKQEPEQDYQNDYNPQPEYQSDPFSHIEQRDDPHKAQELVFDRSSRQQKIDRMQTQSAQPYHHDLADDMDITDPADMVADDNPIFKDLDEAPEVTTVGSKRGIDVTRDLKSVNIMRNAIIIKEVLDAPISKRPMRRGNYARMQI